MQGKNHQKLAELRKKIDQIDKDLAQLLKDRAGISLKIGEFKTQNNLPVANLDRERNILEKLETTFQKNVYTKILEESRKLQS